MGSRVVKKVSKKNALSAKGQGQRVESVLKQLIEDGKIHSIAGNANALERTLGATACKRLADYLEECLTTHTDGVGGIC